jgi:ribosomal protein S18 acetylase RimI-like enzyme
MPGPSTDLIDEWLRQIARKPVNCKMNESILDNPAWAALNSIQAGFAQGTDRAKRYRRNVLPFIACLDDIESLNPLISPGESFYMIGNLPPLPDGWVIEHELPCAQMVLSSGYQLPAESENHITALPEDHLPVSVSLLSEADSNAMYDLINSVQPGYYNSDTRLLGNYYGIREEDRLVAMAGERMRMTGFSELSAICTLPGFTGRGYAQQLISHICRYHKLSDTISFLHVALTNQRAIRLYEHLGFEHRRTISFHRVRKG